MDNVDGLHELVGNVMFQFIKEKRNAFPNATISKQDFWCTPAYKRAMVWVFLLRFLLGMSGQKQWKNFDIKDYKLNVRAFHRWMKKDNEIMSTCSAYENLPQNKPAHLRRIRKKGRSKRGRKEVSTSEASPPYKRSCAINLVSTDEECVE